MYNYIGTYDFSEVLKQLHEGKKFKRLGWNGNKIPNYSRYEYSMYIMLQNPTEKSKMTRPYIYMKTIDGDNVPWVASQTDLLAKDWVLHEENNPEKMEVEESILTKKFNKIYEKEGFIGVLREVNLSLECGRVELTDKTLGLYRITTRGWSNDEFIVMALNDFLSLFGSRHYVGYVVGGSYYYARNKMMDYEITKKRVHN